MAIETVLGPFNNVPGSISLTGDKVQYANYGYNVTEWTAIVFVTCFALSARKSSSTQFDDFCSFGSTVFHTYQAFRYRMHFMLWTVVLGGLVEIIGWSARLWSSITVEWNASNGGFWYATP